MIDATPIQADESQSPGRLLAAARQARGMTVTEVALRLKFSPRQIEALEADHYDVLRGPTMVRGMIRAYARLIGLDPQPMLDALHQDLNSGPMTMTMQPRAMEVPFPRATRKGSLVYVMLSAVIVIAVVSVVLEWVLRPGEPETVAGVSRVASTPPESTAPAPALEAAEVLPPAAEPALAAAPPAATTRAATGTQTPAATRAPVPTSIPAPAPAGEQRPSVVIVPQETVLHAKRIELVFDRESWVEIKNADGRVVFSQLNPPGSRRNVVGEAPFSIIIGNATGVKLRYNDSDVDLTPFTRTDVARLTLE